MRILIVFLALLFCYPALAADPTQDEEFMAAWTAYSEAVESGRASKILKTSKDLAEIAEQLLPESDPRLAKILQNYGVALRRDKKKISSRKVLERSFELMEDIYGEGSIELVPVMSDLADAYSSYSSSDRQLSHYKRALKITGEHYGKESLEYADIAFRAATSTFNMSRSLAGRRYLRDAQNIYQARSETEDLQLGLTTFFLGKMALAEGHSKRAASLFEESLASFGGESDKARQSRLAAHALLVQVYERRGQSDLATEHSIAIGRDTPADSDQDYLPLFRPRPKYPSAMWRHRIEGYVDVEFTVNEEGFTEDARVIKAVTTDPERTKDALASDDEDRSFAAAALAAVKRFRYAPRFEDGVAVPVEKVKARITFKLEK